MNKLWIFLLLPLMLCMQSSSFAQTTGKALFLDGIDDGVIIKEIDSTMDELSSQITIEALVYTFLPFSSVSPRIIDRSDNNSDDRWVLAINSTYGFELNINRNMTRTNLILEKDWIHLAATYDGSKAIFYVNGIPKAVTEYSSIIDVKDSDIYLGNDATGSRPFHGAIDELRVWNRARTQEEIIRTMNGSLDPSYYCTADSGLLAYWQFDTLATVCIGSDSSEQIFDTSLNNNHGILFGGARLVSPVPTTPKLTAFSLISPLDDTTLESTTVTFIWQDAILPEPILMLEQVRYEVYLSKTFDFDNPQIQSVTGELSTVIGVLKKDQTYFWKVLAKNSLGDSLWSSNVNGFYIQPGPSDFGDAPFPFKTMASENGARHYIDSNVYLGWSVDPEYDGCVDTLAACDSDDGVYFLNQCVAGDTLTARVRTSCGGFLSCWIYTPYNRAYKGPDQADGMMKRIDQTIDYGGIHDIAIPISIYAAEGIGYLRFRFSSVLIDSSFGVAVDGEVEDYKITVHAPEMDFGDAPWPFKTLLNEDGARHIIDPGVYLGSGLSADDDGVADSLAVYDFDDGIVLPDEWIAGDTVSVTAIVSCPGYLSAWLYCPTENNAVEDSIFFLNRTDYYLSTKGQNKLNIPVPAYADSGTAYIRFRFSTEPVDSSSGPVINGEVEDYRIAIKNTSTGLPNESQQIPSEYRLEQNYPNPFNPTTTIRYALPKKALVKISVYDLNGRLIKILLQKQQNAGQYQVTWDAAEQPSGTYFIKMLTDGWQKIQKCLLLK